MTVKVYDDGLPEGAKKIRQAVFVEEQGFQEEFDKIDARAAHIVIYNEDQLPIATGRVFWDELMQTYLIGRLAVVKEYRGRQLGSKVLSKAEQYVQEQHGTSVALHAQCRVQAFYEKLGYETAGEADEEEGCPHIWMKKQLV